SAAADVPQFRPAVAGMYRIRVSAYPYQNQDRPLVLHVSAGHQAFPDEKYFAVPPGEPTVVELMARLAPGQTVRTAPYGFGQIYIKDLLNYKGPGLAIEWVEVEGPLLDTWPPESHQRLLGQLDLKKATLAEAEQVVRAFIPRAFRRPVPEDKI